MVFGDCATEIALPAPFFCWHAGPNLAELVHQVRDWYSGAAAYFGWMREAKRENTRYERVMQDRNTSSYAPGLGNPTSRTCKRRAPN